MKARSQYVFQNENGIMVNQTTKNEHELEVERAGRILKKKEYVQCGTHLQTNGNSTYLLCVHDTEYVSQKQ